MRARLATSGIGLDIGASGVRAVQVAHRRGQWTVTRWAALDLPPGVVESGVVHDERAVVRALKQLWRRGRFVSRRVIVGVPDRVLVARQVDLPWMPPADFTSALRYLVADYLPIDLATAQVDHHVLAELEQPDARGAVTELNRCLVVAGDTELISTLSGVVRRAGLQPVGADSMAFAAIRAELGGVLTRTGAAHLIADIGAEQVGMVVHVDGQPGLVRTVTNLGGATATQAVALDLDLDVAEAEDLKRRTGLLGPTPVVAPVAESSVFRTLALPGAAAAPERVEEVIAVLNPWAASVVAEIRNTIDYFNAAHPESSVRDVLLTGRSVDLTGFVQRVATQVSLPVRRIEPFGGLAMAGRVAATAPSDSRCVVAAGLALSGVRGD